MRFGISTHLYHEQRLSREHLAQIASYGFEAVEVFATRSHFDYHEPAAIAQLAEWLKQLKAALGCGGAVEGDAIVLQGDQRSRLPGLLTARGVKKITVA